VIEDFAEGLGVPTPLFSATLPVYSEALAMGFGDLDTASVCAVLEKKAGATRRKRGKGR
jgi:L-threonate 2-dehydrogenase